MIVGAEQVTATGNGLLANYYFNQGQASSDNSAISVLTDASGLGNDGALVNFPLTGSTGNFIAPGGVVSGTNCAPACTVADQPIASATSTTICAGSNVYISVTSGNLNGSDHWTWYEGSCGGGTPVATGNSLTVVPLLTTTYYVRGEGGCITDGACGTITITVHPSLAGS